MTDFSFQRQQRLLNAADYSHVFDKADFKISHPSYLILARRVESSSQGRLGLIAAKKHLRFAVQRNLFKRIARESFRHHQHQLTHVDLIIMARSGAAQADRRALRDALDQGYSKLARKLAKVQTDSPPAPA